ncbi:nuclear transport factor 2 family protein [Mycobacterium sp. ML4]
MTAPAVERWFDFMNSRDAEVLDDLLAKDVRFYSPAVYTPKQGRARVTGFLLAAEHLFTGTDFRYVAQWIQSDSAVLEFAVELDGKQIEGVDIVHWNADHRITSFKVMVRPSGVCRRCRRVWPKPWKTCVRRHRHPAHGH